jgi:hypothetical protein
VIRWACRGSAGSGEVRNESIRGIYMAILDIDVEGKTGYHSNGNTFLVPMV